MDHCAGVDLPELRNVDIEGELVTKQVEHLVLGRAGHQVQTRANVGG